MDLALGFARCPQRRAVIKVSAAVPLAIPAMLLDVPAHLRRLLPATLDEGRITMHAGNLTEPHEHFIQEKTQPDALALAVHAYNVHAVVPVTGADERQAVHAERETAQDGAHTVLV